MRASLSVVPPAGEPTTMVACRSGSWASARDGKAAKAAACNRLRLRTAVMKSSSMAGRVRAHHVLDDVRAPAGAGGQLEAAVLHGPWFRQQGAAPRHLVLVVLHDPEVGDH